VIIQRRGSDLLLIRQRDHAALAAAIMAHWLPGGLPDHPRRDRILSATAAHDDGWEEEDARLHVGPGGDPLDFVAVPPEVKHRIWRRAVARLAPGDPYVAALVAQHALTVHAPLRADAAWRGFFETMARARDAELSRAAHGGGAAFLDDYAFVRTGDLLSLIFCNGWTAPMGGPGYRAILRGITLEVAPDPFGGIRVPLRVEARLVPARPYRSRSDLQQAYAAAPVRPIGGDAIGA
jgi:hypothetical protein